jgi:predicted NBD/HSP70 family sugar kinase
LTSPEKQARGPRLVIGSNPERNRAHNRRVVLEVIRMHGHMGRTEIARRARISPQAVANIVDDLLEEGLLVQLGRLRSGRGQPPIQFAINPDGPLTCGIEIAADHMATTLLDLSGAVRAQAIAPLETASPDHVPQRVAAEIDRLCAQIGASRSRLLGLGAVMPGPFEIEGMSSVGPATLPGWRGVDPKAVLSKATGQPVSIENDATAAAVGERLYGAGRTINNFCFLYFGVGLGLGVIKDGAPLSGTYGNAGEIGHLSLVPRNGTGTYGPDGALERFASLYALREKLAGAGRTHLDNDALDALFAQKDPVLSDWIKEAADYLAPTVAMLENIFDPETVLFGGNLPDAILDALIEALDPLPVSVSTRTGRTHPRVMRGQTGRFTAALGAAALALHQTLSPQLSLEYSPAAGAAAS